MPAATESNSIGGILRAAREEKNIELAELAASLNLAPTFISKIERDDVEGIPLVYLRGYVRNYSKALGIDSEPLLSLLPPQDAENIQVARELRCVGAARDRRKVKYIAVAIVLLVTLSLLSYMYMTNGAHIVFNGFGQNAVVPVVNGFGQNDVAPSLPDGSDNGDASALSGQVGESVGSDDSWSRQEVELTDNDDDIVPLWKQLDQATPSQVEDSSYGEALELVLSGDCWIEIKDGSGLSLLTKMGSAGERIQLSGEFPFSILLGNANVVDLWFEGNQVDLEPHTRGSIARLYLP